MKILLTGTIILFLAICCQADTFIVNDPFGSAATSGPNPDVIGDTSKFDIQQATFTVDPTTDTITLSVYTNYGGTLPSGYQDGSLYLNVGDILFTIAGIPQYGVVLNSHRLSSSESYVLANHVYQITNQNAVATASDVLHLGSNYTYRPSANVWIHQTGGLSDLGTAGVSVGISPYGNGTTAAEYAVTVVLAGVAGNALVDAYQSGKAIGFSFASATCANDIISGSFTSPVPEPATLSMIGGPLALISLLVLRRRRVN